MTAALETLEQALGHHQAGRLREAEALYREVLAAWPRNPDALHLMGMLALHAGQPALAADYIGQAIRESPGIPMFHNNLGTVAQALGRHEQALACFGRALELNPAYPEARVNLGNTLQELRRFEEAAAQYREALRLSPGCAEAHNNLGNALRDLNRREEALDCFRRALELRPDYAEAYLNLGGALRELGRLEGAEQACREALRLRPGLAEAHANLGAILLKQNRNKEAEAACRQAAWLKPDLAEAHANLSAALIEQKKFEDAAAPCLAALRLNPELPEAHANWAEVCLHRDRPQEALVSLERAIALRPAFAEPHNKRGYALEQQGRFDEALACYEEAVRLEPALAEARSNRAMAWLRMGDFARGWEEYEWRWKRKDAPARAFAQPLWDGRPLPGGAILLHAEQGLGDAIQFVRYLPAARRCGARVLLECRPRLVPLLAELGADAFIPPGGPPPEFDAHAPLLSLPRIFGTRLDTVPAEVPYLAVPPEAAARWREKLRSETRIKVGLVWAGNPQHPHDRHRSVPFHDLAPLARLRNAAFFSLQRGARPQPGVLELGDLDAEAPDLVETAAAVLNLDLVITVDTMLAHLAGALGRPVWTLLSLAPDWRWMLGRGDSPWYPTMRLFRQERRDDWGGVIEQVIEAFRNEYQN